MQKNRDRQLVYLVNEFSPNDVDADMLSTQKAEVISVAGGSIFCRCLVSQFIRQLQGISENRPNTEGVVIEASGMANPETAADMLEETGLSDSFYLASIISIVEPTSFLKLQYTLPNIIKQVESADVVLINKTDSAPTEKTKKTQELVRQLNPTGECLQTVQAEAEIDLFGGTASKQRGKGEFLGCRDPNYATFTTYKQIDPEVLLTLIKKYEQDIYRIKGNLQDEFIDYSSAGIVRTAVTGAEPRLVWIVKSGSEKEIEKEIAKIQP